MDTSAMGVCLDTGHANLSGDIYSVMHKLGWHLPMVHGYRFSSAISGAG